MSPHRPHDGTWAPQIFRALVEVICHGSEQIVGRFESEGIPIRQVIGIGGVAPSKTSCAATR